MSGNKTRPLSDLHVLVVEDNEVNQKVTSAMLKHFSINADIAENGQVAIDMVRKGNYDLILMDCQMPVKNGFEATKFIRDLAISPQQDFMTAHDVIIIAMTANASPNDMQACMDHGMNDFIAKPVELDIIESILKKWFA